MSPRTKTHMLLVIGGIVCTLVMSCHPAGLPPTRGELQTDPQKRQIILAANAAVLRHGYSPKEYHVTYDQGNAMWKSSAVLPDPRLSDCDFQLIRYRPRAEQFGGELWVLVDRNTRQELRFLRLQ